MIYTEETKKKLDKILSAFGDYIENQTYFDVLYSKKIGYVWIVIDPPGAAGVEQIDDHEDLLDLLFNDIIGEVINAPGNRDLRCDSPYLSKYEEADSRRRIATILETIEDCAEEYLAYLDNYMEEYQNRYCHGNE